MRKIILCLILISLLAPFSLAQAKRRAANPQTREVNQPQVASANSVEGSYTFGGKTVKVNYAYARLVANEHDKSKQDALVLFTEKPIPRKYFVEPHAEPNFILWTVREKAEKGLLRGFHVQIDAEKNLNYFRIYKDGSPFSSSGGDFKPIAFTRSAVQGRVSIKDKSFNDQFEFNASFKVSLRQNEWTGEFYTPPPVNLESGRAKGQLVIDGKATTFNYVYASLDVDFFDEKNNKTKLLFTEKPVPEKVLEQFGFSSYKGMQEAGNHYIVEYEITSDKDAAKLINIWEVGKLTGASSSIFAKPIFKSELDLSKSDDKSVEGRLYTELPEKRDQTFELNVAFNAPLRGDASNAPVTARNGKSLPVGGGEPGKAYVEIARKLAAAKNARELLSALQASFTAKIAARMNSNEPEKAVTKELENAVFELLKLEIIESPQVTGGFLGDTKATLAVTGFQESPFQDDSPKQAKNKPAKKQKVVARINMHFENGQWKIGRSAIQTAK
jgi:hypothetical protein